MTKAEQTAHDPADVEYMARLLCVAFNLRPDAQISPSDQRKWWYARRPQATRVLDWMQANGVKMLAKDTTSNPPFDEFPAWVDDEGFDQIWYAANPTPRDR